MRIPYEWLKEYVDVALPPEELAERLTMAGLEVDRVEYPLAGHRRRPRSSGWSASKARIT